MDPIIIIGTGLAGYHLAKEYRKQESDCPLIMLTSDNGSNYSKPMLSTGFTKKKTADQLTLANVDAMTIQLNAQIRTNTRVVAIQPEKKRLELGNGEMLSYSQLVLACGAEVIEPPIKGNGLDQVYSVNDLQDYAVLREALIDKRSVAIVGGGLIGCEFANDLANGGFDVQVIEPLGRPLPTLMPESASCALQAGLESLGVTFHYGRYVESVDLGASEKIGGGVILTLSDGDTVSADLVISAVGLRPRIDLARTAGIEVKRGICVNRYLRTSQPDIYALGDCSEVEGHVMLYVLPLMADARALAKTLAGEETAVAYGPMPVTIKTPVCPVVVAPLPADVNGEWEVDVNGQAVKAVFKDSGGVIRGFALTGDSTKEKSALAKQLPPILT